MYLNPAQNVIQFRGIQPTEIRILNYNGIVVSTISTSQNQQVDISSLPSGLYLAVVRISEDYEVHKLIKE
jgi:hypothetical protein